MPIKQTAQQIAQNVAKQTLHESNEFLKSARKQIAPIPEPPQNERQASVPSKVEEKKPENLSFLNSYKSELEEIRRESLFKEMQQKISEGEFVPLENYIKELSFEQREVLKAQIEVIENQKQAAAISQQKDSPLQVVAKKGRNAMMGMFKKKNEQHVETRLPPSG